MQLPTTSLILLCIYALNSTIEPPINQPIQDIVADQKVTSMMDVFQSVIGPLITCGSSTDLLTVDDVVLAPYPIKSGQPLVISATGELKVNVEQGATALVTAKWGFITLFSKTLDLCLESSKGGIACPITEGYQTIQVTQNVPAGLPLANVQINVVIKNADGAELTCLTGKIQIGGT